MHPRAESFAERAPGHDVDVDAQEFSEGTKTAADPAAAVGCDVAQVASSIAVVADEFVVVVTSGANRVAEGTLGDLRGVPEETVRTADEDRPD